MRLAKNEATSFANHRFAGSALGVEVLHRTVDAIVRAGGSIREVRTSPRTVALVSPEFPGFVATIETTIWESVKYGAAQ